MTIKHISKFVPALALVLFAGYTNAQCNLFGKLATFKLKPYVNTSQVYTATLLNNDKTQLNMTFYYGDEYRLIVKADDVLGKVQLNIKDANNNIVFTTKGYGLIQWDFNVENTQDLTLEVVTPPAPPAADGSIDKMDKSGCVAIVVGFK